MSFQYNFLSSGEKASFLITGGGTGIGLALAEKFLSMGHEVVIVGRRQSKLDEAKDKCADLITFQADVSSEKGRVELRDRILKDFPNVNVLINNAAILDLPNPLAEFSATDWDNSVTLFNCNLLGLMHLATLLLPHLLTKPDAMIVNVSSVVAFVPIAQAAVYCASKAAVHSFTQSLRCQLRDTSTVLVVEIVPPLVDTDMVHADLKGQGVSPVVFVTSVVGQILVGSEEVSYQSDDTLRGSREIWDEKFERANEWYASITTEGSKEEREKVEVGDNKAELASSRGVDEGGDQEESK